MISSLLFAFAANLAAQGPSRLHGQVIDQTGAVIPGVTFRYRLGPSARFEGKVDSTGLVTAGSTAILPVTVTATLAASPPTAAPICVLPL